MSGQTSQPSFVATKPARIDHAEQATEYARDVVAGRVIACKWVRLACQRHLRDLERADTPDFPYRFDHARANRVVRLIELLPHVKGMWAAKRLRIKTERWQKFIICCLFGWIHVNTGLRKYRKAYICVPRKNAKSTLGAGIGIYGFAGDGEFGAEVYTGATTERQAWEVFRPARLMVKRTPQLLQLFGISVNAKNMAILEDGSRFEPLVGDPGDGASPSVAIIDEYHEHDTDTLADTMETGMGARSQPLLLFITTAGTNIAGPCHLLQTDIEKILEGSIVQESTFGIIYTIDADDDWTSLLALRKANPNFGISVFEDFLRDQQQAAIASARKQNIFKTKHLNIWCNANVAWLNSEAWRACADPTLALEQFLEDPCWIGVDMASTTDLASIMLVFIRDVMGKRNYYVFGRHYLPLERIQQPENQHYQQWHHQKLLIGTEGAAIDYGRIKSDLKADITVLPALREICYDKTYCEQMMQELADEDQATVVEIPQKTQYLSPAMKQLEAAILDGRVHHNGDPVLAWAMSNVVAHADANDNVFPRKDKAELKIDPAVATLNGFYRAMSGAGDTKWQKFTGF
mgnify:CR=1 FL=1